MPPVVVAAAVPAAAPAERWPLAKRPFAAEIAPAHAIRNPLPGRTWSEGGPLQPRNRCSQQDGCRQAQRRPANAWGTLPSFASGRTEPKGPCLQYARATARQALPAHLPARLLACTDLNLALAQTAEPAMCAAAAARAPSGRSVGRCGQERQRASQRDVRGFGEAPTALGPPLVVVPTSGGGDASLSPHRPHTAVATHAGPHTALIPLRTMVDLRCAGFLADVGLDARCPRGAMAQGQTEADGAPAAAGFPADCRWCLRAPGHAHCILHNTTANTSSVVATLQSTN